MDFTKLTEYLDSLNEKFGVPAADCQITKDHEIVYRHMTGWQNDEKTVPVSEKSVYAFYSASKVITQTAVMQLIEQGKLHLYDPASLYIPEFEFACVLDKPMDTRSFPPVMPHLGDPCHYAQNPVRIIDLMSMGAGLTYDTHSDAVMALAKDADHDLTTVEIAHAIASMPLTYEPGTRWAYSLAHDVLGAIVEIVSGEKFGDYLKKHIFEPLGIENLYFKLDDVAKVNMTDLYQADFRTKEIKHVPQVNPFNFSDITPEFESGGAGIMGTVESYSKVIEALANGGVGANGARILKEESVMHFTHAVTYGDALNDFRVSPAKMPYGYGLGVRVKNNNDHGGKSPIGEFGWDGAAGAYCMVDPINHISVFYAQHIMGHMQSYNDIHPSVRDLAYEGLGL